MLKDEVSSRIEILRFPLIVGVVFIHTFSSTAGLAHGRVGAGNSATWQEFVPFFISNGLARIAVPLFFMISGYLFFQGEWSREKYMSKLKRRVHTLLIPYLFWNVATLAFFAVAQSIPQTSIYFSNIVWPPIRAFALFDYVNALFGITVIYPIAFQFWFIRSLMVLVICAPVIHYFLARKWLELPFTIVMFGLWFFVNKPGPSVVLLAAFFFCFGAYLAGEGKNVTCLDKYGLWISSLFCGALILRTVFQDSRIPFDKLVVVAGVPSIWWLMGQVSRAPKLKSLLLSPSGASFFVFAAHEPLLTVSRKIIFRFLAPTSGAAILAVYFLVPTCIIAFLVVLHGALQKIMPSLLEVITGSAVRARKHHAEDTVHAQG